MANEIDASTTTGLNLYALLFNSAGEVWNGSAFATPAANTRPTYALVMTEQLSKGSYVASMPVAITTPGRYPYTVYRRAGGSPADTDARQGTGWIDWTGSAVQSPANLLDAVIVETDWNARQALAPIFAAAAGVLSGAGTTSVAIKGGGVATTRIAATVDAVGNRSAVTLTKPA